MSNNNDVPLVQIWSGHVERLRSSVHISLLNNDERKRHDRLMDKDKADEFLCSRACLRLLIGDIVSVDPSSIVFDKNKHGKPFCADYQNCCFNLSHSQGHIIIAISPTIIKLGVDIEYYRDLDFDALSKRYLSNEENVILNNESEPVKRMTIFFKMWAQKEACVKTHGQGIGIGLDAFSVNGSDTPKILSSRNAINQDGNWQLQDLSGEHYAACLAADRPFQSTHRQLRALFK